jgi:single-strand DNA-binding protein
MPSLNKSTIIGFLGSDPQLKFTPSGSPTATFSVAVSDNYKKNNEWVESTEWFNVVTWNDLAERCNERISKGSLVYVEGKMKTRSWEGQDGHKNYRTELVANKVLFLDRKQGDTGMAEAEENGKLPDIDPVDLPF